MPTWENLKESGSLELNKHTLRQVFDSLPDAIFLTDAKGDVLLSNSTTALSLGMSVDQMIGKNLRELIQNGYYNTSYALEAAKKKTPMGGIIHTRLNLTFFSTSTPILDENGEVKLILTTGRFLNLDDKYNPQKSRAKESEETWKELPAYLEEYPAVITENSVMRQVLLKAYRVAQTNTTVLLLGETGTGKEVLARYIHRHSQRSRAPFVTINCAALPDDLVESELFGYEKGAFTGAKPEGKAGLFEYAHQGTLFLDEIGELPLYLQGKLLRVLDTKEVRRLGGNRAREVDVRIIAATNRDLEAMVQQGTFRRDLYYRLNVFPLRIPPLRERPEDIVALSFSFLKEFNKKYGTNFELDYHSLQWLLAYDWPGNVRELRNTIERMVINSSVEGSPGLQALASAAHKEWPGYQLFRVLGLKGTLREVMQQVEEQYIRYVLEECGGRVGKAAERLGIYRTVLYRKLKSYEKRDNGLEEKAPELGASEFGGKASEM